MLTLFDKTCSKLSHHLKITVVQFKRDKSNFEANLKNMVSQIKSIPETSDIIVLPEAWLTTKIVAWDENLSTMRELLSFVPSSQCLLVSGAQYTRDHNNEAYSRGVFLRRDPPLETWYEKIFPSHLLLELYGGH